MVEICAKGGMAVHDEDWVGYYDLRQLSSAEETSRQKKRVGVFPWSKAKIRRLVKRREFPQPVRFGCAANAELLWRKADIHQYMKEQEAGQG